MWWCGNISRKDTVTLQKDNAILVTPYANSFENVGNRILIKNESVDVFDKVEVTLEKSKGKLTIYPPTYFLIQNPTEKEEILTYNLIRHGNPVCFGIYGLTSFKFLFSICKGSNSFLTISRVYLPP